MVTLHQNCICYSATYLWICVYKKPVTKHHLTDTSSPVAWAVVYYILLRSSRATQKNTLRQMEVRIIQRPKDRRGQIELGIVLSSLTYLDTLYSKLLMDNFFIFTPLSTFKLYHLYQALFLRWHNSLSKVKWSVKCQNALCKFWWYFFDEIFLSVLNDTFLAHPSHPISDAWDSSNWAGQTPGLKCANLNFRYSLVRYFLHFRCYFRPQNNPPTNQILSIFQCQVFWVWDMLRSAKVNKKLVLRWFRFSLSLTMKK